MKTYGYTPETLANIDRGNQRIDHLYADLKAQLKTKLTVDKAFELSSIFSDREEYDRYYGRNKMSKCVRYCYAAFQNLKNKLNKHGYDAKFEFHFKYTLVSLTEMKPVKKLPYTVKLNNDDPMKRVYRKTVSFA